jgi:hypothetical protein
MPRALPFEGLRQRMSQAHIFDKCRTQAPQLSRSHFLGHCCESGIERQPRTGHARDLFVEIDEIIR